MEHVGWFMRLRLLGFNDLRNEPGHLYCYSLCCYSLCCYSLCCYSLCCYGFCCYGMYLCWYGTDQCSHQTLLAKGHKYYLLTTPIILNVVIVSTKHLLHVYHCQQSILA